jgi:phosphopantothenoylcysteine decarboxylase / phosphopantothenate---cysteine ligase
MGSKSNGTRGQIQLCVGAGVATFKAVALASKLRQEGFLVRVAMSHAALEFVEPLSFRAVCGGPVVTTSTSMDPDGHASHLRSGESRALVLLPATADLIGKVAHGLADDAASLAALCAPDQRLFCPAMNDHMWRNPFVQENVARLEKAGWERLGPVDGMLGEGYPAIGRMIEPEEILARVLTLCP